MSVSRETRIERRRRIILNSALSQTDAGSASTSESTKNSRSNPTRPASRTVGYSHEVRWVLRERSVQWIPRTAWSYAMAWMATASVVLALCSMHYAIFVSGLLRWYGNPLAVLFDISHPQSIAHWIELASWYLCLLAAVYILRIRRHKLDDYRGEYRVWWIAVGLCFLAGMNASTQVVDLLGEAIDRWARAEIGWSGDAVLMATILPIYGMVILRWIAELRSTPISLILFLGSAVAMIVSLGLSRDELQFAWSLQWRVWLRHASWLTGVALLWLAMLGYLRYLYRAAQSRFAAGDRSLPQTVERGSSTETTYRGKDNRPTRALRRQNKLPDRETEQSAPETSGGSLASLRQRLLGWVRPPRIPDDAPEYRKKHLAGNGDSPPEVTSPSQSQPANDAGDPKQHPNQDQRQQLSANRAAKATAPDKESTRVDTQPKDDDGKASRTERLRRLIRLPGLGLASRFRPAKLGSLIPKVKLPSIRLKPPRANTATQSDESQAQLRKVPSAGEQPLPSTTTPRADSPGTGNSSDDHRLSDEQLLSGSYDRPLTRAERKRLKRLRQRHRGKAA